MTSARERIEEEVTCPVCMDGFTIAGERIPRILPCHHTICESCLKGISRAENQQLQYSLKCPSCRNEAVIPDGDITNFEVDFRVNRLQEVLARLQQFESPVSSEVAKLRPEVNKSAVALRSFLRQLELATRQNIINSQMCKKKVAANIKLCLALLKQKEKEMIEEIESRREENEHALVLQQEEAALELGNIESVLALERSCFSHLDSLEAAREAEAEIIPLLEIYSKRHLDIGDPILPATLHAFPQELSQLRRALTEERQSDAGEGDLQDLSESDSSLDDSGISDTPPERDPVHNDDIFASSRDSTLTQSRDHLSPPRPRDMAWHEVTRDRSRNTTSPHSRDTTSPQSRNTMSPHPRDVTGRVRRPVQSSLRHFSTTWGSRGSGPGHLDTPTGLCVVSQTQVAVADAGNCRVCVFDSDGSFLRQFGKRGRGPGQLNCPNAVASRAYRIYVADTYNHRISIHRADGQFISSFGSRGSSIGEFDRPIGITTTEQGEVLVADTWNHRLQVFDLEGNFIRTIGKRGTGPGEFQCPCGVALNSRGDIYVCDLDNKRIQILDNNGKYLRQFGRPGTHQGALHAPRAVAIDVNDYVYATEYEKHFFQVFDPQDRFVSRYGSHGNGVGEFDKPCGVAVDSRSRVIVSDSFNHRLQMF